MQEEEYRVLTYICIMPSNKEKGKRVPPKKTAYIVYITPARVLYFLYAPAPSLAKQRTNVLARLACTLKSMIVVSVPDVRIIIICRVGVQLYYFG